MQKDPNYMQAGACCKHYVAYDVEGNGGLPSRVYFDAQVDTRSPDLNLNSNPKGLTLTLT